MATLIDNEKFRAYFHQLEAVRLNPRRHTAPDARSHSEAVADLAVRLGRANGRSAAELELLHALGLAHDIGKVAGTARPEQSVRVLQDCGIADPTFLALVRWHDVALPWFKSAKRGEPPSPKAWQRLARDVDLGMLCLFMVADRVDAPGGWRGNPPTRWFLDEAAARGYVSSSVYELPDHPSQVSAGAVVVKEGDLGPEALLIRTRTEGYEIPKGRIEWDELPEEAAVRECREETGLQSRLRTTVDLGAVDYPVVQSGDRFLKRARYFLARPEEPPSFGPLPSRTRERVWVPMGDLEQIPLVSDSLRPILIRALEQST